MAESVTLGAFLAGRRVAQGLTVDDVAGRTKIVPRFVQALEDDRPLDLPAPVYVRGFVRAYCEAVGSDPEQALALLEATLEPEPGALDGPGAVSAAGGPVSAGARPSPRVGLSTGSRGAGGSAVSLVSVARPILVTPRRRGRRRLLLGAGLGMVLAIVLYPVGVKWAERRRGGERAATPRLPPGAATAPAVTAATAPPPAPPVEATADSRQPVAEPVGGERAQPGSTPAAGGGPGATTATTPGATSDAPGGSVAPRGTGGTTGPVSEVTGNRRLVMRASDTTWVRVKPEDEPASVVTLLPGTAREWRSAGRFRVTLGNAGGVELELDGKSLPALGTRGEVVRDVVIPLEPGS